MSKNKKKTEEVVEPLTEFKIDGQTVPVVPHIDDLSRSVRRRLRNVLRTAVFNSTSDYRAGQITPEMQDTFVLYAHAYAESQGVMIDLDEPLPEDKATQIDSELLVAGLALNTHFRASDAEDDSKNVAEPAAADKEKPKA